ncbi:MAG: hypothetical protein K1563_12980 [Candidatus Thiodiazotropha sp. (ex. Lucinisca nassula)]|nr:hypothetical protein [Candidatus Thiodiazotropha sp. (ex. Lucinisca nassula)]MBW9274595.1 hypothetical protein [Candidatus Thiodiazotropha sp. (ex. Lucinisca nassula)]
MKRFLLLLLLVSPVPVLASHAWSDVDICKLYEDKLPPGLSAESLPDPTSQGAGLLARYCTQCHNLPGPDRHTATEWRDTTAKMFMLMDVSNRFGGLMGRVEVLSPDNQLVLLNYLQRYAAAGSDQEETAQESTITPWLSRALALLPVLLLTGLGLLRWWLTTRHGPKPCVTD